MTGPTLTAARAEEQGARRQHRNLEKARRAAARAHDRAWHQRLAQAIRETRPKYPRCRCELHATMTRRDLHSLAGGCTDPYYTCPRLDAVRRRTGA